MCTTGVEIVMLAMAVVSTTAGLAMKEDAEAGQRKAARYQARVAETKAQAARYEADNARKLAKYDANNMRREFLRSQGTQRSLLASSGVDMAGGSAMDVLLDNASQARRDQEYRLYQGDMDAWRYENQTQSMLMDAEESRMQAANSRVSGWAYAQGASSLTSQALGGMK